MENWFPLYSFLKDMKLQQLSQMKNKNWKAKKWFRQWQTTWYVNFSLKSNHYNVNHWIWIVNAKIGK